MAVANGMKFPEKPTFFDLTELECRLIAPRLAFQKIIEAPRGKQLKINGNVVNVDFHQGFESRFGSNAGKQCVAMCPCHCAPLFIMKLYQLTFATQQL